MPLKATNEKARTAKKQGKSFTDMAEELVVEVIKKVRKGVRGASIAKKAIAIGITEARRAADELQALPASTTSGKARIRAGSTIIKTKISGQVKAPVKKSTVTARSASTKKTVRTREVR